MNLIHVEDVVGRGEHHLVAVGKDNGLEDIDNLATSVFAVYNKIENTWNEEVIRWQKHLPPV